NSIAIPDIFMLFNEYNLSRDDAAFNKSYKDIPKNKNAGLCVECGECIEHCPQKIDIPKKLKHIHKVPDSIG
ncbi:MAG TPA: 4Fe-4S dicluster domain-containing protein, partial [Clostridiales bacterium]|nr:4Fe-4S dicluster domain-containing protein [Clostridiales bacterium]